MPHSSRPSRDKHGSQSRSQPRNQTVKQSGDRKFERKKTRPPVKIKAEHSRSLRKHYKRAVDLVKRCNRPQSLEQLFDTLTEAVTQLKVCNEMRPDNSYLCLQLKICEGEKRALLRTRQFPKRIIPLVLDPAWKG